MIESSKSIDFECESIIGKWGVLAEKSQLKELLQVNDGFDQAPQGRVGKNQDCIKIPLSKLTPLKSIEEIPSYFEAFPSNSTPLVLNSRFSYSFRRDGSVDEFPYASFDGIECRQRVFCVSAWLMVYPLTVVHDSFLAV